MFSIKPVEPHLVVHRFARWLHSSITKGRTCEVDQSHTSSVRSMSFSTHVHYCHRYAHLASEMEDDGDLGIHSCSPCSCVNEDAQCRKESDTESLSSVTASNFALLAGVHDTALEIALCYMRTAGRQLVSPANSCAPTDNDQQLLYEYMDQLSFLTSVTAPVAETVFVDKEDDGIFDGECKAARSVVLLDIISGYDKPRPPLVDMTFLERTLAKGRRLVSLLQRDESTWCRFALSGNCSLKVGYIRSICPNSGFTHINISLSYVSI